MTPIDYLRQLANSFVHAAIWRIVWGLPLWVTIVIAIACAAFFMTGLNYAP
ncbi:MAG: hypothetical protein ACRCYS_05985 [Beijerinckiaceae bacterium]